jgi:hypothetical protein
MPLSETLPIASKRGANHVVKFDPQLISQYNHPVNGKFLPNVIAAVVLNGK